MFNKLRNNLALFNGIVLVLFVILFIGSIWLIADKGAAFLIDKGLTAIAAQVEDLNTIPPKPHPIPDEKGRLRRADHVNYIFRDETITVTTSSEPDEDIIAATRALAQNTLETQKASKETIEVDGNMLRIYSVPFHKNQQNGIVQTYFNMDLIMYFLTTFFSRLLFLGLIAAIAAGIIGWLLAGRALFPIKKSWQKQKDFVADASHELRTPLTIIQSNLDVVLNDPESTIDNNMKWLQNAYSETENMGKLINDLLLLAQIDASEIELNYKLLDISEAASMVGEKMGPAFINKSIYFANEISSGIYIYGDEIRIRQLMMILLDNALKYTPQGGKVKLQVKKDTDNAKIIVSDTGTGISEEDKERIFDRFYRADKARSRSQGGTGLGLSIAHWIVETHKGKIIVKSRPGTGSSFIVEFPGTGK